jgi:TATA-binding protein-associated factor Taf7
MSEGNQITINIFNFGQNMFYIPSGSNDHSNDDNDNNSESDDSEDDDYDDESDVEEDDDEDDEDDDDVEIFNHLVNECMHNLKHAVCIPTELFSSSERHRP